MNRKRQPNQTQKSGVEDSRLSQQLNPKHPLVKLASALNWKEFEAEFGQVMTAKGGRRALPTRLMVGLHYLKALYDESDESY